MISQWYADQTKEHIVFLISILGVYLLLTSATIISRILAIRTPENATFAKVKTIVRSWWIIIFPPTLALLIGPDAVLLLFFIVSYFGIKEIIWHTDLFSRRWPVLIVLFVCTALQYLAIACGWKIFFYAFIPIVLIWVMPIVVILKPAVENFPRMLALIFGSLLVSYYLSHIPALMILEKSIWTSADQSRLAILILLLVTELNDVMQFLSGKAFGKRKLVPILSPNKTEAGFVGGILGSMLLFLYFGPNVLGINRDQSLLLGACISISGIFGDLIFSSTKRYFKVKDFSELIAGHGGLLDRLDSLILTAPVYFHLIRLFKGGSF